MVKKLSVTGAAATVVCAGNYAVSAPVTANGRRTAGAADLNAPATSCGGREHVMPVAYFVEHIGTAAGVGNCGIIVQTQGRTLARPVPGCPRGGARAGKALQ
jgi:hypothetical protein